MIKILLSATLMLGVLLLSGCPGSTVPAGGLNGGQDTLTELEYDLTTDQDSTIGASDVDGQMVEVEDAENARGASSLPASYLGIQGMYFSPASPPGAGFSGRLTVRITEGEPQPNEYDGVLLFLFYIDPATFEAVLTDSSRGTQGNWVTFDLDALGYFIIAENLSIPRPGTTFTVSAFADLASTAAGTLINFWALQQNGVEPVTYSWNFGEGSVLSGEQVSHSYLSPGEYSVSLVATDASGAVAPTDSTPIEITAFLNPLEGVVAHPPLQDLANHLRFTYGATITGGKPTFLYDWDFDGDGTSDSSAPPPVNFTFGNGEEGVYVGSLTVTDANSQTASASFISDSRLLNIQSSNPMGVAPHLANFSLAAAGIGPADNIVVQFGDGAVLNNPPADFAHTFIDAGAYVVSAAANRVISGGQVVTKESNIIDIIVEPAIPVPTIQLTQPLLPPRGSTFSIYGYTFGDAQGNQRVELAGVPLVVDQWTDTLITAQLPVDAGNGVLRIIGSEANSNPVILTANPTANPSGIQNVIPFAGPQGDRILIVGHGFTDVQVQVAADGAPCTVEVWNPWEILATLPSGIAGDSVSITVALLSGELTFNHGLTTSAIGNPVLSSANPPARVFGAFAIDLSGSGFGNGSGGVVFCDGLVLPTLAWSDTLITINQPSRPVDSWVVVINRDRISNAIPLAFIHPPQITSVTPSEDYIGQNIGIFGLNFGQRKPWDYVTLGEVELILESWDDKLIVAVLPDGATNGDIIVQKRIPSNGVFFTVIPPPPGPPTGG
ncbi:PKD domain-containing protein [bacterium]|nr:PKD domain-containing protein [bacterium]